MTYSVSEKAKHDIRNLYLYGLKKYGQFNADKFLMQIHDSFDLIVTQPHMGMLLDFPDMENMRKFPTMGYIIYYKAMDDTLTIDRVIHGSADPNLENYEPFQ